MNKINKSLTLTGRSGNGSCSAPPGDDMDDTYPCQLHIWDGTEKTLVARGKVFEAATVLHGMELSEAEVKVISLSLGDQITTTLATSVLPVCSEENS